MVLEDEQKEKWNQVLRIPSLWYRPSWQCVSPSRRSAPGCCGSPHSGSMDLPRIASHTSLCSPNIQILTDYKPRTPVSKKLLSASAQQEPQFAVLPSSSSFQPSRKREEARALQNLRRRVQAVRVVQANQQESIESCNANQNNGTDLHLDNRPHLLQKVMCRNKLIYLT